MKTFDKYHVVQFILDTIGTHKYPEHNMRNVGVGIAPANIALIKYWGKAHTHLNIPYTDSLSVSLGDLGATTKISILNRSSENHDADIVILNGQIITSDNLANGKYFDFYNRIKQYLDLFREYKINSDKPYNYYYKVETDVNIPIAAGLASSACGFAALVLALDNLFTWKLDRQKLSILARLGSGSACRSLWHGFVYWQRGQDPQGLDSHGYLLPKSWPELCIGLVILSDQTKAISSRDAMLQTALTSILYQQGWQNQVHQDLALINNSFNSNDFTLLGTTAENNALAMHATMLSAKPAICYSNQDTMKSMSKVWELRKQGLELYFTQDAGPNLKLLFLKKDKALVEQHFSGLQIISPFNTK